jgi:hypothetical protein
MEFTDANLQTIKLFGQEGQTLIQLSSELGVMCHQFEELRKTDNRLDEALKIYDYNFKQFMLSKFYSTANAGKNPQLAREMYLQIYEFLNDPNKGKLKIEIQEELLRLRDSLIDIYYRHLRKPNNILIFEGGSRSGKTNNIVRDIVRGSAYRNETWNIIAPSYKMLNKGSFIDIKDFIDEFSIPCKMPMNATDIRFAGGGSITFEVVISENEAKRNRDNVFINEADGIPEQIANLIIGRAKGRTLIDYNPTKKFWSEKYKNETNTLLTTWKDNPYLSENQLEWFARLKKDGEFAEIGSPERYVYAVYYCGNYSIMSGKAYELSDFDIRDKVPAKFDYMVSYSDPSLGVGADYFASLLFGIKGKEVWAIDCIFSQFTTTAGFIEQLKAWDIEWGAVNHYAEKNGTSGVVTKAAKEMYDGVLMEVSNPDKKEADIIVYSTTAKRFKFKRSQKMMNFINQCVEFPNSEHDDAPDCLGRGAKIILKNFDL